MTDLKTLKQLIKLMVENDLTELDVEGEGEAIRLKRAAGSQDVQYVVSAPNAVESPRPSVESTTPSPSGTKDTIASPMVGTFYAAPSPDAKPFVGIGDNVNEESVVCIVEAMKVFNEIKAEKSGTISNVLVENGQSVEFGQPLFEIKP